MLAFPADMNTAAGLAVGVRGYRVRRFPIRVWRLVCEVIECVGFPLGFAAGGPPISQVGINALLIGDCFD